MGKEEALRRIKEAAETGATELYLRSDNLTSLPLEFFQLTNLTVIYLSDNQLSGLPPEICQLTNLRVIEVSSNKLSSLPPEIGQLTNLSMLSLSSNKLRSLPPEICQLTNLRGIEIRGNQLSSLPPEIGQLTRLTELYLSGNQLSSLPPEFFQLTNLTKLNLGDNQLTSLPPEIVQLTNLTTLHLNGNQFSSLPPEIVQLPKLKELYLYSTPLTSPPIEIAEQGISAIREYFAEVEGETKEAAEVKVILVGEGASGKTSLTRLLRGERFNEHEPTTHGIRIKRWRLNCACRDLCCNLWDFGGQEIMHATHQFFLSRRSLYVLVLDGRRDERPEYWLRYIETFGGGSPVLVVLNKWDANPGFDLNRPFLKEKYPFIVDFYRTSCFTGQGVEPFKQALLEELGKVPLSRNRWPAAWFRAKEMLEQMDESRISYEKFEGILLKAGVKGQTTRNVLAAFLHDLGIVIHFDEFKLKDHHVLDPKWVTGAVYKIINAPLIAAAKGLLRLDDLEDILQWKEGEDYRYWPADHVYIIELMKQFELCYALNDKEVLIPQLLGVSEPSFEFDYSHALRFELRYEDFLPPSVMPRFIVKRHQEIQDKLRWRSGVVLANAMLDAAAVVRMDNETRRIQIIVTGTQRKAYLTVIMLALREINSGFPGLKVSERVPMPDDQTRSVDCEHLRTLLELGQQTYTPEGSKKVYKVRELLDTVDDEKMLKILQEIGGAAKDKESFLDVVGKNLKAEPELFGFGINLKAVGEAAWQRYKAWRG